MSRLASWFAGSSMVASPQGDPAPIQDDALQARLKTMQRSLRRRLSDRIEAVFEEACVSGDLQTAETLLVAIEHHLAQRPDSERRTNQVTILRLREKIARHREPMPVCAEDAFWS
jgi:hypothetical protein